MPTPAPDDATIPDSTLKRARWGVTLLFLTNGLVWANLVPRYPEIRDHAGLSYGQFGAAVACGPAGALIFGLGAGWLIRRFTSRMVGIAATSLMAVAALCAGLAPTGVALGAALFALGSLDAIADVAQNSHGLRVQRGTGRSMLNGFHATWSVGAVAGGVIGGISAGLHVPVPAQLAVVGIVIVAGLAFGSRLFIPGPEPVEPEHAHEPRGMKHVPFRSWAVLIALGFIAIAGVWVEDAGASWSASYLRDDLRAGPTIAAMAFVSLMTMHFLGRIFGDRLVDRFGQRAVARTGGVITIVGMGAALLFPSVPLTIVGFGLAGLGVATTVPAAMHGADELPGFRTGTGLSIASWMLRLGFLISPPIVGAIADEFGLRAGLLVVPVAGVIIVALAGVLSNTTLQREPRPAEATAG